jgi:transglutaminase-like putative cysteine protease
MKRLVLIVILLCIPLISAETLPNNYQTLIIDGSISNPIDITQTGNHPSINSLTATIAWYPLEHPSQEILFFTTIPASTSTKEGIIFTEKNPYLGFHSYDIEYQIKTVADKSKITQKNPFPIPPVPQTLTAYVASTETIDITPEIKSLSADLAANEDDLFLLTVKIAAWVNEHINYNLSTASVQASQPASWVLENREGVCDEITNLYIAMLRSLGIPARFVSGVAYTSSDLFAEPWGAHGWAEVYFPEVGWIPFDVTYGQYGWVDASHIVFGTNVDNDKFSSRFTWLGKDVHVKVNDMKLIHSVVKTGEPLAPHLSITVKPLEKNIGIGSYQLIIANIENDNNFYVADVVQLASVEGLTILDQSKKIIVLAPFESQKVTWQLLIDDDLGSNYLYTYPIVVGSYRGALAQSEFMVSPHERILSASWTEQFAEGILTGATSQYNDALSFSCNVASQGIPRIGEEVLFRCFLENKGELDLEEVNICFEHTCTITTIPAGQPAIAMFNHSFNHSSLFALSFTAHNDLVEKFSYTSIEVIEAPLLLITQLSIPESIGFSEEGTVTFAVVHESGVSPKKVHINLRGPRLTNSWDFDELTGETHFEVHISGNSLSLKNETFVITTSYLDDRNERINIKETFTLPIREPTWWQRIILWFLDLI